MLGSDVTSHAVNEATPQTTKLFLRHQFSSKREINMHQKHESRSKNNEVQETHLTRLHQDASP